MACKRNATLECELVPNEEIDVSYVMKGDEVLIRKNSCSGAIHEFGIGYVCWIEGTPKECRLYKTIFEEQDKIPF